MSSRLPALVRQQQTEQMSGRGAWSGEAERPGGGGRFRTATLDA